MNKPLYKCFNYWFHGGTVYFYSDPHFEDYGANYLRKNYIGDIEQIKSIKRKVSNQDTLIILGDIGNPEYLKKLHCYKVLVLGNHDRGASFYEPYVDEVYNGCLMINNKIILSHEPVTFKYAFNIHGHDHSNLQYQDDLHLNVCAEHINYTPVCINDILRSGKLKNIPDIHRETIDNAVKLKLPKIKE